MLLRAAGNKQKQKAIKESWRRHHVKNVGGEGAKMAAIRHDRKLFLPY
jgi:hypothetical protein